MDPGTALLFLALLGSVFWTSNVFDRAHANGHLLPSVSDLRPRRDDWKPRIPRPVAGGKKTGGGKTAKGRGPGTVPQIVATAVTTNWLRAREHRRANRPPRNPGESRRDWRWRRLRTKRVPPAETPAAPDPGDTAPPAQPAPSPDGDAPVPDPATPGGIPVTTPLPNGNGGGGAAGDLLAAIQKLVAEAKAGGLKTKARVALVFGEGFKMAGPALTDYANHMADKGEYPPMATEPVQQSAAMVTAAGAKMTDHATVMHEIARTPMGEAQGKAPAKPELDRE